jgi:hypothetical protein
MSASKPATFDPLDAPLWESYNYYQSLADSVRAPSYKHLFWVDPKHWLRHKPPAWVFKLKWESYRYSRVRTTDKLKALATRSKPGIYIFSVKPDVHVGGFPSYALYVGISNANDSGRSVRDRLADYLPTRISTIKKRNAIHRMVCLYFGVLYVHFAYVTKPSSSLMRAEKTLHGYLAPPVAQDAYPVDMKPFRPAW